MGTVDVIYPSSPFFLLFAPKLLAAQLRPVLEYAASPRWKFPFAPHDLGSYPKANGQVYGGGEKTEENQMPVEESGNMLLMLGALAVLHDDVSLGKQVLADDREVGDYLESKGFDPDNQLCTDDFAGHLAHNANLSLKAILALAAAGDLAKRLGNDAEAARLRAVADGMVAKWDEAAKDGDHYRLAFDRAGTWSQKYNLVWDTLLGFKLFPDHGAAAASWPFTRPGRTPTACRSTTAPTTPSSTGSSGRRRSPRRRADFAALVDPILDVPPRDAGPRAVHRLVLDDLRA